MTLVSDLIAARALIDTPEKWIKGDYERGKCFCVLGALRKVGAAPLGCILSTPALDALTKALPKRSRRHRYVETVWIFNDAIDTTHADILALFDRAISKALGEPHA